MCTINLTVQLILSTLYRIIVNQAQRQSCDCSEVIAKLDNMQDEDRIEFEWLSESQRSNSLNPDDNFLTRSLWPQYWAHYTHIWRIIGCFVSEQKSTITFSCLMVWCIDKLFNFSPSITNGRDLGGSRSVETAAAIGQITKVFCCAHTPAAWFHYFLVFDLGRTHFAIWSMWQEHMFCVAVYSNTAGFQCHNSA